MVVLEEKAYICRDLSKPITIEVIGDATINSINKEISSIPIVGIITAGMPIWNLSSGNNKAVNIKTHHKT